MKSTFRLAILIWSAALTSIAATITNTSPLHTEGPPNRNPLLDANSKFYLNLDVGVSFQRSITLSDSVGDNDHVTFDPGVRCDVEAGYNFARYWATELEMGLNLNAVQDSAVLGTDFGSVTLVQLPVLVNLIYRVPIAHRWTAYVGGGAGGVFSSYQDQYGDATQTDAAFAFQGKTGIEYALNAKWAFGIAYKILGTTEHDVGPGIAYDGVTWTEYKSDGTMTQSILATFTFKF